MRYRAREIYIEREETKDRERRREEKKREKRQAFHAAYL
jgi:hypothetical protein